MACSPPSQCSLIQPTHSRAHVSFGGGGSGSRLAPAQSFSAPTQSFSAPTQSFSAGSGTRSVQSFAPTSTYQPAAPMPATQTYSAPVTQSYSQPIAQSYGQPASSGCGCGGVISAPVTTSFAPSYSQPVYTPSNYTPAPIFRSRGCGCN